MSFKQSYLNIVNTITQHSVLATLIMLIALGGVGASAAQLIAPDQYKPSKFWKNNFNKQSVSQSTTLNSSQSSNSSNNGILINELFEVQGGGQMRFKEDANGGNELKRLVDSKIFAIMGSVSDTKGMASNFGEKLDSRVAILILQKMLILQEVLEMLNF